MFKVLVFIFYHSESSPESDKPEFSDVDSGEEGQEEEDDTDGEKHIIHLNVPFLTHSKQVFTQRISSTIQSPDKRKAQQLITVMINDLITHYCLISIHLVYKENCLIVQGYSDEACTAGTNRSKAFILCSSELF